MQAVDLGRLREAGHGDGVCVPQSDIRKRSVFFAIGKVEKWRGTRSRQFDAGGVVVNCYQLLRMWIGEWVQQDAFDDTEDRSVRSDADGQSEDGDGSEHGGAQQAAEDVLEGHIGIYGSRGEKLQSFLIPAIRAARVSKRMYTAGVKPPAIGTLPYGRGSERGIGLCQQTGGFHGEVRQDEIGAGAADGCERLEDGAVAIKPAVLGGGDDHAELAADLVGA